MKNIKTNLQRLLLTFVVVFSFTSCENEFTSDDSNFSGNLSAPIINSVSEAREDVIVTQGVLENTYIIRGENLATLSEVFFNGYQASVNTAFVTDNIAFVSVPEDAPYIGQANIMRIVTLGGTLDYDFSLLTIEGFSEGTYDGKKAVFFAGGDFSDTSTVTFVSGTEETGDLVEKPANILLKSETEVIVEVPAGVEQAFIFIETSRGAIAQSDSYGFSYAVFIDELNSEVEFGGWAPYDVSSELALGENSVKVTNQQWNGMAFLFNNNPISPDDYSVISLKIYGGENASRVRIAFNEGYVDEVGLVVVLEPGVWNDVTVPLNTADFWYVTGPEDITNITIQEFSGEPFDSYIYYVDDFGFIQ